MIARLAAGDDSLGSTTVAVLSLLYIQDCGPVCHRTISKS